MTFFFRNHTNFVPSASCFLDNSDVESNSGWGGAKKEKRKRVVIYSERPGRMKVMTKGRELKLMSKLKMMKSELS